MPFTPNDMLTPAFMIGATNEKPGKQFIKQQYRGLDLFPWTEYPERRVIWDIIKAENPLAGIYDPRGQAIPGDEISFDSDVATMADIKASRNLETWSVDQLRDPGMPAVYAAGGSSNTIAGIEQRVKDHIGKRLAWCNDAVDAQVEYLALQALQGTITWPPTQADGSAIAVPMPHWNADMIVSLSTGLPAAQNQNVTTLSGFGGRVNASPLSWQNTAADPFEDLEIINEYMLNTFGIPMEGGRVLMSRITLGYLMKNTILINWMAGANREQAGARGFASRKDIREFVEGQFGWTIETYDSQWTYRTRNAGSSPTVTRVNFLKEGKIIILPPGDTVGEMMTAKQQSAPGSGAPWLSGKVPWKFEAPKPPYDIELGVNAVTWPRLENTEWFVLDSYN